MHLFQASQAPVTVTIGEFEYVVPKLTMDDIISWSNQITTERNAVVLKGLNETQQREYLTFYPPVAPDVSELSRLVRTGAGMMKVLLTCLPRAKGSEKNPDAPKFDGKSASNLIRSSGFGRCLKLAIELADLVDNSKPPQTTTEGDSQDPLDRSGKTESTPSAEIGSST